jgi:hypothetical protein
MSAPRQFIANAVFDLITARVKAATLGPVTPGGEPIFGPKRVYPDGTAPSDAVPGYLLYATAPEFPEDFLSGQVGVEGDFVIACWADTKPNADRLAQWLADVVTTSPLVLSGHDLDMVARKGTQSPDPGGKKWQTPLILGVEAVQHA